MSYNKKSSEEMSGDPLEMAKRNAERDRKNAEEENKCYQEFLENTQHPSTVPEGDPAENLFVPYLFNRFRWARASPPHCSIFGDSRKVLRDWVMRTYGLEYRAYVKEWIDSVHAHWPIDQDVMGLYSLVERQEEICEDFLYSKGFSNRMITSCMIAAAVRSNETSKAASGV